MALRDVMAACNAAATRAAWVAFEAGVFSQPSIHRLCYAELRESYGLSAQLAVRAIGKAVEVFRRDKSHIPSFRADGAITYDERCFSFKGRGAASILTRSGRVLVPVVYGEYQRQHFDRIKGQVDLVLRDGQFYLHATIDVADGAPIEVREFLGVDLGVVNVATTSDGEMFSGAKVEVIRVRRSNRRRRLQRAASRQRERDKRPRSVLRALKRLRGKESRFKAHENHCISKHLSILAQDTKRGIAVEDLRYIRQRIRFAKSQRARMGGWAFAQLQGFLAYKAKLRGVPFVIVNARYTSQTCAECAHCERANRESQAVFVCASCGHSANADVNGARNIAARAVCNAATGLATTQEEIAQLQGQSRLS
jgi:putative transposase